MVGCTLAQSKSAYAEGFQIKGGGAAVGNGTATESKSDSNGVITFVDEEKSTDSSTNNSTNSSDLNLSAPTKTPAEATGSQTTPADTAGSTESVAPTTSTTSNEIDITAPDPTKDETLENANSVVAEINVEVPASAHIDPTATINRGVYADDIDLSGLTYHEAKSKVEEYVTVLRDKQITLKSINDHQTTVSACDLGIKWSNSELLVEAIGLGKSGNIIARYKANKDLENEHKVYDVNLVADKAYVNNVVQTESDACGSDAKDATMTRENGAFVIIDGQAGYGIDVEQSVSKVMSELSNWNKESMEIDLVSGMIEPKGTAEELSKIKDKLGTFTTSFSSSGKERSGNVRNGTKLLNGKLMYPGEQLSVYEAVSPFTEENGYFLAGSYSNGLVVESLGGGICQVSSTLYNAVIRAELQVDERSNHSMIVTYVDMSADAAISGTYKDFKFTNNLENPIFIEGYTTDDKQVVFNIYGVETRPANRTLAFESVELEKTEPEGEKIVADPESPVGSINVQSAHTGYRGEYWKIIKIDGVETERVRLNRSTYQATPKTAAVGTKADDALITQAIQAAIDSGSIDTVKETIAQLQAAASATTVTEPAASTEDKPQGEKPKEEEKPKEDKPSEEKEESSDNGSDSDGDGE